MYLIFDCFILLFHLGNRLFDVSTLLSIYKLFRNIFALNIKVRPNKSKELYISEESNLSVEN